MRVEEIALRQEARQMLSEAGLTKESLKEIVLQDLDEKVARAIDEKTKEIDFDAVIMRKIDNALDKAIKEVVDKKINGYFSDRILKINATASLEHVVHGGN